MIKAGFTLLKTKIRQNFLLNKNTLRYARYKNKQKCKKNVDKGYIVSEYE
jgi:hypothetical protein